MLVKKHLLTMLGLSLFLASASQAAPSNLVQTKDREIETHKNKLNARLQRRIQEIQALQACIMNAKTTSEINECRRASLEATGSRHQ